MLPAALEHDALVVRNGDRHVHVDDPPAGRLPLEDGAEAHLRAAAVGEEPARLVGEPADIAVRVADRVRSRLETLARLLRAGAEGVLLLGLDMQDARENARKFLREFSITYTNVHEAGEETSRRYGMTGIPETFFISRAAMWSGT